MDTEKQSSSQPTEQGSERRGSTAIGFARRHPALSVLGAAGVGLLGGVEVAAGVLLGAGVVSLLHRGQLFRGRRDIEGRYEDFTTARPTDGGVSATRERARRLLARAPREIEKRARAVLDAMRGKIAAAADVRQSSREPSPMPPPAV